MLRRRLVPPAKAAGDRARRLLHAIRHTRPRAPEGRDKVFNLDLHVSVIADVRTMLESRGIGVTQWSISGHTWVFGRERDPVAVVNERTYRDFDPAMVARFQRTYGTYLRQFRGFVATHTPCFALLYRGLPGPTLAVCSTRYEWPLTFKPHLREWLDDALRQGVDDGWLELVANNRADADYVENYLGIRPRHIPSACAYIAPTYTGRRKAAIVYARSDTLAASICGRLKSDAVPLRSGLGGRHSWAQLYDHRAIVLVPWNVSLMALFEHYSACMPIYVPTRAFMKGLMAEHPEAVLSQLSYGQALGRRVEPPRGDARDLNDIRDEQVVDWYLDRADFYDEEWMPAIRQFESWTHLDHLLSTDDHLAISRQMAVEKPHRLVRVAELWDETRWLGRLGAGRDEPPPPS